MEALKVFLDFLSKIAWPILAGAALYYFRDDFRLLLTRLRKIWGAELGEPQNPERNLPEGVIFDSSAQMREVIGKDALEPFLKSIRDEVGKKTEQEQKEYLTYAAATLSVQLLFERIYTAIFGSQIKFLQALQQANNNVLPVTAARAFYDQAEKEFPVMFPALSNFNDWINYLTAPRLVIFDGAELRLTALGHSFMQYLSRWQRHLGKQY